MDASCARTTEKTQLGKYTMTRHVGYDASLNVIGQIIIRTSDMAIQIVHKSDLHSIAISDTLKKL